MKKEEGTHTIITNQVERSRCQQGKLLNQYLKIKKIGEGPFSKIKLMRDIKTGKHYAMKKYNMFILKKKIRMSAKSANKTKYSTQADQVYNEIQIMKLLNHPYVIKLYEILQDDEEQKIYLIMDYCQFGDIVDWDHKKQVFTSKWSLKQIAKYFKQIAEGLQYIHSLNIVHRDLKPQNIVIDQTENAKLIDFSRSVLLKSPEQKLTGSEGTYQFMAPEMLSQKIVGGYDGKLCDIWSLGVSLFCCVLDYLPFSDDIMMKLFQKIQNCQYKLPQKMPKQKQKFIPLIKSMLQIDCTKRPNLKNICQQLVKIENEL